MLPLKAQVRNGRLVLDEPTDLPDGNVVYLQLVDGFVGDDEDDLDDQERAELHRELEASIAEVEAGHTRDFGKLLARLRQRL